MHSGSTNLYLVLAVLVGKVAVPIYWEQLKKLGASSQDELESMLQAGLQLFDLQGMTLLANREYDREVSIFRDGLAILSNKCQDILSFIQYLLSVFSSKTIGSAKMSSSMGLITGKVTWFFPLFKIRLHGFAAIT